MPIPQEVRKKGGSWNGTVFDTTLTDTRVYTLLKSLQLHDVLRVFRQKMHQPVDKQGFLLSGGQRQIVVLLRAVFNTYAKVMILDEPTSSVPRYNFVDNIGSVLKLTSSLGRPPNFFLETRYSRVRDHQNGVEMRTSDGIVICL